VVDRTRPVAYFVAPDVGNYSFTVSVNDSYGESVRTVNVTVRGPNLPPRFLSQPPRRATVGKQWRYEIRFVDDDAGDRLDLALSKGPEGMVLDSTALHWTPRKGQAGEQALQLALSDGRDTIYQNWTVTVEEESSWGALFNGPVVAGVVLLIVVAAVAVMVVVRRRRAGGRPPN